jgi:hypothetical protein
MVLLMMLLMVLLMKTMALSIPSATIAAPATFAAASSSERTIRIHFTLRNMCVQLKHCKHYT